MNKVLEKFYVENRLVLVKRLTNRAGSIDNAEDILQEAFARALKYGGSFDPKKCELGAWFNTIMNNALRDFKKAERLSGMSTTYEEDEEQEDKEDEPPILNYDLCQRISKEIAKRDINARSVLHLYFERQYKVGEIKQVLDIPYKTAESIIYRFKADMADEYGEE